MSWLTPLGFLGLIGLIVWLIIYIIKPNYQKKIISTTYVWKLSLKYRKKRIPISKLRNILLIICQILTITAISAALAQPYIMAQREDEVEKIIILDASADMMTALNDGGENRFDRAVLQIHEVVNEILEEEGRVSVILASHQPEFIVQRAGAEFKEAIHENLDMLTDPNDYRCTYGIADMDAAMKLAEEVLNENPKAEIVLYTGTIYTDPGEVTVVDVSDVNEWNCAILSAKAEVEENFYEFTIELASYNRDTAIEVYVDIYGVNDAKETMDFNQSVFYTQEMGTVTLTIGNNPDKAAGNPNYILAEIYSYEYAYIHIEHADSLQCDNTLYLYGGTKPELKILYYSTLPNPFFQGVLRALVDTADNEWDVILTEISPRGGSILPAPTNDYDIYVFEHTVPMVLPSDGVVILANPNGAPSGSDFYLGSSIRSQQDLFLTGGDEAHPLMEGVNAEAISLTQFTQITNYGGDYIPLMYCQDYPVMLATTGQTDKIVVMPFSLNNSNLPLLREFPTLMLNLLKFYIPSTVEGHLYEVNDTVNLNARSPKLKIDGPGVMTEMTQFPGTLYVTEPGVYTLVQTPISGEDVIESIYVKIPASESNIRSVVDTLESPHVEYEEELTDKDLVFYFAMLLVALLFCEWLLQLKEYF